MYLVNDYLKGLNKLGGRMPFYKGDNSSDFLFAFLQTKSLLKGDLLWKEKILPHGSKFCLFKVDLFSEGA